MFNIFSPLEQFEILPIFDSVFGIITNATIILILIFIFVFIFFKSSFNQKDNSLYVIPHRWQVIIEIIYKAILSLVTDNISGNKAQYFFPLVFSLFFFILNINLIGLIPYSFTLTSHLVVTFSLSIAIFIGINIICFRLHGIEFFSLFFPAGTSLVLALLLVPVEILSYVFRPISLGIRLFANMMAGHTLLKVFAGFAWTLMGCSGILFFSHLVPLLVLLPLLGLELAVAFIQAFVFSVLTCLYLNDSVNLH
jgi:ATP synthase subunit 6|tara:strand:+ start:979 stop:1734 length:756 start_codon:yes stop_codon:yes gene_type:complete